MTTAGEAAMAVERAYAAETKRPIIIGLIGLAGSGKSTVAEHLERNHQFTRIRFADPLKNMMRALGLDTPEVDGNRKEAPCDLLGGKTPRHAMQTLGTEWGRQMIDGQLWVRAWERRLPTHPLSRVVVEDCRFHNEESAIRRHGGAIWRVLRPEMQALDHVSEREQAAIVPNAIIHNFYDVESLHSMVDTLLAEEMDARAARELLRAS